MMFRDLGDVVGVLCLLDGGAHHARAGNAHVDDAVRLAGAVESARHEGVVLRRVAEHDELCRTDAVAVRCAVRGFADNAAHFRDGIHVDAGLCRADVDGGADQFRFRECFRDAFDQSVIAGARSLYAPARNSRQ